VLILTTQQKIYAEDTDDDLSNLSTTQLVLVLVVTLALGAFFVTSVAADEANNKKSSDGSASGSTSGSVPGNTSGSTLSDSNSECNRLQKQASDIRFQCQINGKSASDCENDMVYVVAKKQADDTCYFSK
jgi:hypothetical protein